MKAAFTDKYVRSLKPPETGRVEVGDASLPGLVIRITPQNVRSWAVRYKVRGADEPQRRHTLGIYPAMSLADARERARAILDAAHGGIDLLARERVAQEVKEAARTEAARITLNKVADGYEAYYASKWRESSTEACLVEMRYIREAFGDRPITSIVAVEVFDLVSKVGSVKATQGNRIWGRINAFFGWAVFHRHLPGNPCGGISRQILQQMNILQIEAPRQRVLSGDEIRRVLLASDAMGYPSGWYVRFLLMTAQREKQALKMAWSDLAEGDWIISPDARKTARFNPSKRHLVPLPRQALEILERVKQVQPKGLVHVWTSAHKPNQPYSGLCTLKQRLDRRSGVTGWRLHDLRRTARTGMAALGVSWEHAERVVDHAVGGQMDRVYNIHNYREEKAAALQAWADHLDRLVAATPATEPVEQPEAHHPMR